MRLTERDIRLVRDVALSHAMSRDQVINLGYFASVTRANTRLRELRTERIIKVLDTPFHAQQIHAVTGAASGILGERIAALVTARSGSPRFLQHALCVTNVRIAMAGKGASVWRYEQQARTRFDYAGREWEVRPDGLAVSESGLFAVEVDLGHVDPAKFREKLVGYDAFAHSGQSLRHWQSKAFTVFVATTGKLRASRLAAQLPAGCAFNFVCRPAEDLGIPFAGAWS